MLLSEGIFILTDYVFMSFLFCGQYLILHFKDIAYRNVRLQDIEVIEKFEALVPEKGRDLNFSLYKY